MIMVERRSFGRLRKRPSGRWQAAYVGPDMQLHYAPTTFEAKDDAVVWLTTERKLTESPHWIAPKARRDTELAGLPPTLAEYAGGWLVSRDLRPRTRSDYRQLLDRLILPALGDLRLTAVTPTAVRNFYTGLGPNTPTLRARAYGLLHTIMGTAVAEQLITINPCVIRGASNAKTAHRAKPATLGELATIAERMPDHLQLAVLIAAWCGLRFGELVELRRRDVDLVEQIIHVRRGVVRVDGKVVVGKPKSDAGIRDVAIPPHLVPEFRRHLSDHVTFGRDALLFGGRHSNSQLAPSTLYRSFYPARAAAGRPDLRWHDLRHTGATLVAATGASLAELMARIGHSTAGAALRYQHAASDRDRVIAEALSRMAVPVALPRATAEVER
jgi:integrase